MEPKMKYKKTLKEVDKEVSLLKTRLEEHQINFQKQPKNYGYIGDLNYVLEQLKHLNTFLRYEEIP